MSKKVTTMIPNDSANPDFTTETVFVQGKRIEIVKGKQVEVDPIVVEIIQESNERYGNVVKSVEKITPTDEVRTGI